MAEIERYPFDYESMAKGTVIPADVIEGICGVSRSSALYSGNQVDLCHQIESELLRLGRHVTVVCIRDEIRVLTDSEASEHNTRLFRKGHMRLLRAHRKLLEVDTAALDPSQSARHERTITVQAAVLSGAAAGQREAIKISHRRSTPGLPAPDQG